MKLLKTFFLMIIFTLAVNSFASAKSVMVSDVQMKDLGGKNFLLRIRSAGPQAFDVLPPAPLTLKVRLYQATIKSASDVIPVAEFGSYSLTQDKPNQVLLTITYKKEGYKAKVSQGSSSNVVEVRIAWDPDVTPPVISAVNSSGITLNSATITWATNELSDSQVLFGTVQPENQMSALDTTLLTNHKLVLTGLLSKTSYYFRVKSKDAAGNSVTSSAQILTTLEPVYQESGGQIVLEAEKNDSKIARGGKDWATQTASAGYSGTGYLVVQPNTGVTADPAYVGVAPELIYNINFTKTGTYYIWIRGIGPTLADDSIHAGLDKAALSSADKIDGFTTNWSWSRHTMDGTVATFNVTTPGLHTFHLWMREDGFQIDKILLSTNGTSTPPTGTGPAETARS